MDKQPSLCFVIACKVYRTHISYIPFYVSKIKEYYPGALIILVDNNSVYKEFYDQFKGIENLVLLENTSESKFELGAYKFATNYIHANNYIFDYYICTQDTFVLVNKFDFTTLVKNNVKACSLGHFDESYLWGYHIPVLTYLNLYDPEEKFDGCWCGSWIVDYENLLRIAILLMDIKPITRHHSEQTERYMGKILKMLNNGVSYSIHGDHLKLGYDYHSIDSPSLEAKESGHFFIKHLQSKTETTPE